MVGSRLDLSEERIAIMISCKDMKLPLVVMFSAGQHTGMDAMAGIYVLILIIARIRKSVQ